MSIKSKVDFMKETYKPNNDVIVYGQPYLSDEPLSKYSEERYKRQLLAQITQQSGEYYNQWVSQNIDYKDYIEYDKDVIHKFHQSLPNYDLQPQNFKNSQWIKKMPAAGKSSRELNKFTM